MKRLLKTLPWVRRILRSLDNQNERHEFVMNQLKMLPAGSILLDAGSGSQQYRKYCEHLVYKAQDFGQFTVPSKKMIGAGDCSPYAYGKLDYVGDIWKIEEADGAFDAILCTEVLEHIPYPNETVREFGRLLKPNGILILTSPSACLRHMDPYFFYSGFSDRWYEKIFQRNGLRIESITAVGDYYRWLAVEMARTALAHSLFAKIALAPAFLYYYNKRRTKASIDTLCMGYHVVAKKDPSQALGSKP
jgi:SAM-dependent methyltransferase